MAVRTWTLAILLTVSMTRIISLNESVNHNERRNQSVVDNTTDIEKANVFTNENTVRKCCPIDLAYKWQTKECINISKTFDLPVYSYANRKMGPVKGFNVMKDFKFIFGKLECPMNFKRGALLENFQMLTNGRLFLSVPSNVPLEFIYAVDEYCIDTIVWNDGDLRLSAFICIQKNREPNSYKLYSTCMLISCFFILLTLAVYAWLPELRNLHGMVLMAYLLSFFVGFLFLTIMHILILREENTGDKCMYLSFIIYFSLLCAFFWLNVMCYDIWWTFSGKRAHGGSNTPHKRFFLYALYAFGVPTALTILLGALEFSYPQGQHPLLPNLRYHGICFLRDKSKLLYFYGPIGILCVANIYLFTLTSLEIAKVNKDTDVLRSRDSSTHHQERKATKRFTLYFKLFAVMGISWIMEVVSYFFPDTDYFWQFFDAYNGLIGFLIFIIFVCKRKTFHMIKKRIKDYQRSDTDSGDMKNVNNIIISHWRTNTYNNASLDTIKTIVGVEPDTRNKVVVNKD